MAPPLSYRLLGLWSVPLFCLSSLIITCNKAYDKQWKTKTVYLLFYSLGVVGYLFIYFFNVNCFNSFFNLLYLFLHVCLGFDMRQIVIIKDLCPKCKASLLNVIYIKIISSIEKK